MCLRSMSGYFCSLCEHRLPISARVSHGRDLAARRPALSVGLPARLRHSRVTQGQSQSR